MVPARYELIVFDWDGTLFDSTALIVRCIQAAVADVGGSVPSDGAASYVIGMGLMQALAHAAPDVPPSRYPLLGQRYQHHYALRQNEIALFKGVLPLLERLKARGHRLAVATGKSRRGLDQVLGDANLKGFFESTRTADETAGKPDPRMLKELMAELAVDPARCLMVGDTSHDLQMASNAGCDAVGVSYGAHGVPGLEACQPRFIAHSVPELGAWLQQQA